MDYFSVVSNDQKIKNCDMNIVFLASIKILKRVCGRIKHLLI